MSLLMPHPPATLEQMRAAVADWRAASAHERFRAENNICGGYNGTALHNAALYDSVANQIEQEIAARAALAKATEAA